MRNSIFFIAIFFVVAGCVESKTNKNSLVASERTDKIKEKNIQKKNSLISKSKTDNIDYVNNQAIINDKGNELNKAIIVLSDSSIFLTANIKLDHRIFGFSEPNKRSKRMLLLSVFTDDVENNPFDCELGAYYDTSNMQNMKIKYISTTKDFVKAKVIELNSGKLITVFFEKNYFEFIK